MVQKRPFVDEGLFNGSSKHLRQFVHNNELFPILEFIPFEPVLNRPFLTSGDIFAEFETSTEDIEISSPGRSSISPWGIVNASEDDVRSEATVQAPFSPEYFNPDHQIRSFVVREEVHSSALDHPPRRSVPIGKDHQADIPIWHPHGTANSLNYLEPSEPLILLSKDSEFKRALGNDDEKKLMGTSVNLMFHWEQSAQEAHSIGNGRIDCPCLDSGSFRCVRQHIIEARENLGNILGTPRFLELGFGDMGEEVAERWTKEEEQTFHEIVLSNPASLGKNFWDSLSVTFPYRSKKDLVSYYFNVFMLRKRAEQNRCDQMNIDSDNDECQGSEYSCEEISGMGEDDDENSVVESPYNEDEGGYRKGLNDDGQGYKEDGADQPVHNKERACAVKSTDMHGFDHAFQPLEKFPWEETDDQDVQNDSCTSSDTGPALHATQVKPEDGDRWSSSFIGLNSGGHGYVLEPCDTKVWDTGYITCPRNKIDFLPTYSVIEEVFGDGDRTPNARDGKGQR